MPPNVLRPGDGGRDGQVFPGHPAALENARTFRRDGGSIDDVTQWNELVRGDGASARAMMMSPAFRRAVAGLSTTTCDRARSAESSSRAPVSWEPAATTQQSAGTRLPSGTRGRSADDQLGRGHVRTRADLGRQAARGHPRGDQLSARPARPGRYPCQNELLPFRAGNLIRQEETTSHDSSGARKHIQLPRSP